MSITVSMLFSYLPEDAGIHCPYPKNEILGMKNISELGSRYDTAYLYTGAYDEKIDLTEYENLSVMIYSEEKLPEHVISQEKNNIIALYSQEEYAKMFVSITAVLNHGHVKSMMSDELLRMLQDGCELQEIMDYGYEKLRNPIMLVDASFNYLASSGVSEDIDEPVWEYTVKKGFMPEFYLSCIEYDSVQQEEHGILSEDDDILKMKDEYNEFIHHRMTSIRIIQNKHVIGYLSVMERQALITEYDISILRLIGSFLAIELAKSVGKSEFNFTLIENFLLALLKDGISNPEEIELRQRLFDIRLQKNLYVITVEIPDGQATFEQRIHLLTKIKTFFKRNNGVLLNKNLIILYDTDKTEEEFRRKTLEPFAELLDLLQCRANISYPFSQLRDLHQYYMQTLHCIKMRKVLQCSDILLRYDDIIDDHMIYSFGETVDLNTLVHRSVRILLEADKTNDSNYVQTLFTYIACGRNLTEAAKEMELHYNTLKYRINRIVSMTGVDLQDERVIFKLMVTEKALKLLDASEKADKKRQMISKSV